MTGPQTHPVDLALPALSLVAVLVGLLAVYSSSLAFAIQQFDDPNYYVIRQAAWAVLGFGAMLALSRFDYRRLAAWSPLLMLGTLTLVALTLVPGIGLEINGARRWLAAGPLPAVQPSELAKLALIIYTAAWLATRGDRLSQFVRGVVPFVTIAGLTAGLILRQPDFGTAVLILLVA
ncbi:MAG: FtsW/RodA/SpoVE family cell cycle protein, partial [Chloroflexi bacterium]|nr:FtsW/RodA/SpoVE family cell cycle protein [Chloroflexota bacterium]